jgi:hypothetical protein
MNRGDSVGSLNEYGPIRRVLLCEAHGLRQPGAARYRLAQRLRDPAEEFGRVIARHLMGGQPA